MCTLVSAVRPYKGRGDQHQSKPSCNIETGNIEEQGLNKGIYQSKGCDVSASPYIYDPTIILLQHKKHGLFQQQQGNTALSTGLVFRWSLQTLIPVGIKLLLNPRELGECIELLLLDYCCWIAVNYVNDWPWIHHRLSE